MQRLRFKTHKHHLIFIVLCFFSTCAQPEFEVVQDQKILMDTFVSIRIFLPVGAAKDPAEQAVEATWREMARLDTMLSNYQDDNEIARINRTAFGEPVAVSAEVLDILKRAQAISAQTDGAFDVTVGALTEAWGFGRQPAVPASEVIARTLTGVGFRFMHLDTIGSTIKFDRESTRIDLGGIAKGAIIDAAYRTLKQAGYHDFLVDAGGDLRVSASALTAGKRNVWVTHPRQQGAFYARFALDNGAVATTGDYERYFHEKGKKYHHILNPATGYPSDSAVSTTLIAPDAITADALATAFFIIGPKRAIAAAEKLAGVDAMVVFEKDRLIEALATENLSQKIQYLEADANN